ncbi:MAG: DUF2079 domain-containing protein [Planctomycetales bacterium]|nr:DUF2079 domain-containing protein [Planctomycetales bacterium]
MRNASGQRTNNLAGSGSAVPWRDGRELAASHVIIAIIASVMWVWGVLQLGTRVHFVSRTTVAEYSPPLWGALVATTSSTIAAIIAGGLITYILVRNMQMTAAEDRRLFSAPVRWLLGTTLLIALDIIRDHGVAVPYSFFEPLWFAFITGEACASLQRDAVSFRHLPAASSKIWYGVLASAMGISFLWWYREAHYAYCDYMLGYPDFGQFARRIINTSEGRGLLLEAEHLPMFWDHFNPGLLLLVPLWKIWPSAELFIVLQACCLSGSAGIVFAIARRMGASLRQSAGWSIVYLTLPHVGQLNLSCGYGWHPVTIALPFMFATLYFLLVRSWWLALLACVVACSFKESVVFIFAMSSGVVFLATIWPSRLTLPTQCSEGLKTRGALFTFITLFGVFVLITRFAGFSGFQATRFAHLGASLVEIVTSPVTQPGPFWSQLLRMRCLIFALCLFVPIGLTNLWHGRVFIFMLLPSLAILCQMNELHATSIGFQYTTTLTPLLMLSAIVAGSSDHHQASLRRACAASVTLCVFLGATPFSQLTLDDVYAASYVDDSGNCLTLERIDGSMGNEAIDAAIDMVNKKDSRVLATPRIAAHLLNVQHLESIDQFSKRLPTLDSNEQSKLLEFDWIIADYYERFHQDGETIQNVLEQARANGFETVYSRAGVFVMKRPSFGS